MDTINKKFDIDYAWADSFWDKIEKNLSVVVPQVETPFHYLIKDGKYLSRNAYWWTNGFLPGMMRLTSAIANYRSRHAVTIFCRKI